MTLSLGRSVRPAPLTIRVITTLQSDPRDFRPLRHLIRVMRRHDLTKKNIKRQIQRQRQWQRHYRAPPKSNPRDLWPLRHLIRVMRRHDLTNKKTMTKTKTKTMTMTKTNTFRGHLQGAILETFDHWDIWSEWWGDLTWPKKRQWQRQRQRKRQWKRQIYSESIFKEQS